MQRGEKRSTKENYQPPWSKRQRIYINQSQESGVRWNQAQYSFSISHCIQSPPFGLLPAIWLEIKVASLSRPSCKKIWKVDKNSASEINCHDLLTYLFAVVEPWKDWNLSPQEISCNRWNYVNCLMIKRIFNKYKGFFGAFKFCYSKSLKNKNANNFRSTFSKVYNDSAFFQNNPLTRFENF